jgi:2-polyprenyl-6-methoxyphenol hydroxylase-like FAD-dependent oxidoreductase
MRPRRTIIVGGGVGGMAFAAACDRLGLPFVLLERAPVLSEVGSGLGILPGAVRALRALGVGEELFARGAPFRHFVVCSSRGDELADVSFTRIFEQAGCKGYVLHRGSLHAAIAARVRPDAMRTGAEVVAIEQADGEVRVRLRDGSAVAGDLLVGADGLNSVVRRHVLDDGPPRYAGETIFRGIADFALARPDISRELFGAGRRAAYYELGPGRVYWWATAPLAAGTEIPQPERRAYLAEAFAGWAFDLPAIFTHTPERSILQNDIYDRPPSRRWHRGRAVLLGDAAHPTTPNLGQGACMAIEDAVVLARAIAEARDSDEAFARFHRRRSRRTTQIVRMSRWWGRAGLWKHPALTALRDGLIRYGPDGWMERAGAAQYTYDPGGLPEGLAAGAGRAPEAVERLP